MKNFISAFILVYVLSWAFLFFGGMNIFFNFYSLLAFVSLIITSVGTLFVGGKVECAGGKINSDAKKTLGYHFG